MHIELFVSLLVFLLLIILPIWGYLSEKKDWNNGISPIGEKWKYFDMDSHGGRGYMDSKQNTIWISYPVDK